MAKKVESALRIKINRVLHILKSELKKLYFYFVLMLQRIFTVIKNFPSWIVARPAAVKQWIDNDRKKKKYRSFKLQKKIKPEPRYIPKISELIKDTFKFLYTNKSIFFSIIFVHGLLYFSIIRSPITTDFSQIQNSVQSVFGDSGGLQSTSATVGAVISASGGAQANSTTATIAVLMMSLVYIWAIRQLHAGKVIKARDAYYQGLTSVASSALVLFVASLQLIPFAITAFVYSTARTSGIFASGYEDLAFFVLTIFTALLSFYWITSTVIGLYIVTLPGMYPLHALRASKKLVQFQRLTVFRRILALPIIIGLFYLLILLLIIKLFSSQVFFIMELLQLLLLPFIHTYLYKLYRALI